MKIILIPDETTGRSSQSLSPSQVRNAMVSVGLVVVLSLAGAATFGTIAWQKAKQLEVALALNSDASPSARFAEVKPTPDQKINVASLARTDTVGADGDRSPEQGLESNLSSSSRSSGNTGTTVTIPSTRSIASTIEAFDKSDSEDDRVVMVARAIARLRTDLDGYQTAIADVRNENDTHLSVLGARVGQLQAHVIRLNALGLRLTEVAKLTGGEFDFNAEPAIGGATQDDETDPGVALGNPSALLDTLDRLDLELAKNTSQLDVLEALIRDRELDHARYPAAWPADGGWISSSYGHRRDPFSGRRTMHKGLDIAAREGTYINAAAAGVVTHTGHTGNYGLMVEINHGNGYTTRYGHASEILVKVGEKVDKGGAVAKMGSTGRSTGSHLHFEVLENSKHVDPRKFLRSSG